MVSPEEFLTAEHIIGFPYSCTSQIYLYLTKLTYILTDQAKIDKIVEKFDLLARLDLSKSGGDRFFRITRPRLSRGSHQIFDI